MKQTPPGVTVDSAPPKPVRCTVRIRLITTLMLALAALPAGVHAAPADLDLTFDGDGKAMTAILNGASAKVAVAQSDGKVVLAGPASDGTSSYFALVRYNQFGSLDGTFNTTGIVTTSFNYPYTSASPRSAAIQNDGRIVVCGQANGNGSSIMALARYNPDGLLDPAFAGGRILLNLGNSSDCSGLAIQSDGKILIAGSGCGAFCPAGPFPMLARYTSDGALDTTFGSNGWIIYSSIVGSLNSVAIDPENGWIAAAGGTNQDGFFVMRFDPQGLLLSSKLTTFPASGSASTALAVQADSKIVLAGFTGNGSLNVDFALARYDGALNLDPTFGIDGKVVTDFGTSNDHIASVAIQTDGKIVAAGTSSSNFGVARYNTDGSLDNSLNGDGKVVTPVGTSGAFASSLAIQADGKIVVAGTAYQGSAANFAAVRYLGDPVVTATPTETSTPIATPTGTAMLTPTGASTQTPVSTPTQTATGVPTESPTNTATIAPTPAFACPPVPAVGCRTSERSSIVLKDNVLDSRDSLVWRWRKGTQTDRVDFGDPPHTTDYALCIYDESGSVPNLVMAAVAPAGGTCVTRPCWKETFVGFRYRDRNKSADGLLSIILRSGRMGRRPSWSRGVARFYPSQHL